MNLLLWPLSFVVCLLTAIKNYLYDHHILVQKKLKVPVLSIGNITLGGTGKTPIVDFLLKNLESKKIKIAVVSRAYKAEALSPVRVDILNPKASTFYGDEAVLLAAKHPGVHFYVGQSKSNIAEFATHCEDYDLIIVDDGFQHRRLHRNADVVVIDATQSRSSYNYFPMGRAREDFKSLSRSTAIFFSKVNWSKDLSVMDKIQKMHPHKVYFKFDSILSKTYSMSSGAEQKIEASDYLLFCGLAMPSQFFEMMAEKYPLARFQHKEFPDHYQYSILDIERLLQFARQKKLKLVTTEKDAVKLKAIWPKDENLLVAGLEFSLKGQNEEFSKFLHQSII